jgi:hypothetical protein
MGKATEKPDDRSLDAAQDARQEKIAAAAKRALDEAKARRAKIDSVGDEMPREIDGRDGPEPIRFGDWEVDGKATDF